MSLNELKSEMKSKLPRTDCRLRPDIRKLEEGDNGKLLAIFISEIIVHLSI